MIINYYKGNLSMEKIRELTKTGKNGTTAFHIIEACKQIGFNSKGIKTKLQNINKENIILLDDFFDYIFICVFFN